MFLQEDFCVCSSQNENDPASKVQIRILPHLKEKYVKFVNETAYQKYHKIPKGFLSQMYIIYKKNLINCSKVNKIAESGRISIFSSNDI